MVGAPLVAAAGELLSSPAAYAAETSRRLDPGDTWQRYWAVIQRLNDRAARQGDRVGLWRVSTDEIVRSSPQRTGTRISRVPYPAGRPSDPRRVPRLKTGFRWADDDFLTRNWRPQGITSNYDALGGSPGATVLLVSWDAHPGARAEGTRISLVHVPASGPVRYWHALLAEPEMQGRDPGFRAVHVHAGGLVWYGKWLYVTDTRVGLRVFHLENMLRVRTAARNQGRFGFQDGYYSAEGYAYVLPQVLTYRDTAGGFTYSQVALDRSQATHRLVVSEWSQDGHRPRIARWPLNPRTGLLARGTSGVPIVYPGPRSVQGAVSVGGRYYLNVGHGVSGNGELRSWRPAGTTWELPPGPEDLSYDARGDVLWTLGEYAPGDDDTHPGKYRTRYVYALRR
ncbi:hypothetical protein [Streptomyces sp. WELS2]|uniref:hypothetical protein n=1 Tax=Streptomyces sp. WELS2 TaxID=2749435 RepID=UPI0015F06C32|nr:hypothetical protein [Streptomyces sp. WELS2]